MLKTYWNKKKSIPVKMSDINQKNLKILGILKSVKMVKS